VKPYKDDVIVSIEYVVSIISAVIFIVIVVCYRSCRTLTVLLVLNTVFAGFVANMTTGS
jgi:presenilin-like A22 family membrane protease